MMNVYDPDIQSVLVFNSYADAEWYAMTGELRGQMRPPGPGEVGALPKVAELR